MVVDDKSPKYNIILRGHDNDRTTEATVSFDKRGILTLEIGDDDRVTFLLCDRGGSANLTLTIPNADMLHLIERYIDGLKKTDDAELDDERDGGGTNPAFAKSLARLKTIIKRA